MKSSRREFLKRSGLALGFAAFFGTAWRTFAVNKRTTVKWDGIVGDCVVTCPVCKTQVHEQMVSETPKLIYHCPKCLTWLSPKKGDHCIYDSYGSVKCPPIQVKMKRMRGEKIPDAGTA
jgi:anaerobic selenocysteine-containing dehydrogenase